MKCACSWITAVALSRVLLGSMSKLSLCLPCHYFSLVNMRLTSIWSRYLWPSHISLTASDRMFSSSAAPINVTVSEGLIGYREHNVANQGYKSRKPAVKNCSCSRDEVELWTRTAADTGEAPAERHCCSRDVAILSPQRVACGALPVYRQRWQFFIITIEMTKIGIMTRENWCIFS